MAFGFFKKAEKADIIFKGGRIYTQDADLPWAEAVACKDGRILRVGSYEDMEDLEGGDTVVSDLGGATMLPGFIDMGAAPAMRVFEDAYEDLSDCETWEDLIDTLASKVPADASGTSSKAAEITKLGDIFSVSADNTSSSEGAANLSNGDSVFGGSFDGGLGAAEHAGGVNNAEILGPETNLDLEYSIFAFSDSLEIPTGKDPSAVREDLDKATGNVPLILLLARQNAVLLNTAATEYTTSMVQTGMTNQVTMDFLVEIFNLIDFEELQRRLVDLTAGYCERGFTGVVNNGFVDYFDQVYTDMLVDAYNSDLQKQRLFGKLGMRTPANPDILVRRLRQRQTFCTDLQPAFNADGLQLDITDLFGRTEFAEDETVYLDTLHDQVFGMCLAAADAGMNIKICVHNKEIALEILKIFTEIRDKGYRKNIFTLCHELNFDEEERANYSLGETIMEASLTGCEYTDNEQLPGAGGFTMNVGAPEITGGLGSNALSCAKSVEQAIDMLTYDAAVELGMDDELGSIVKGKLADFAIFEKNPLECKTVDELKKLRARQTVLGGRIVYDEDEEVAEEWYNLLINQQY